MLGEVVVLPALRSLHARHPQIRVDLVTGTGRLDVSRRETDVALRYARPESGDLVGFPGMTSSATTRASAIGALARWVPSLCATHASCCARTVR